MFFRNVPTSLLLSGPRNTHRTYPAGARLQQSEAAASPRIPLALDNLQLAQVTENKQTNKKPQPPPALALPELRPLALPGPFQLLVPLLPALQIPDIKTLG